MKSMSISRKHRVFSLLSVVTLGFLAFGQVPAHATTDAARIVKYAQNDIVPVKGGWPRRKVRR